MQATGKPRIALIGTGNMGGAFADRLLSQGYPLTIHNRTRAKADPFKSKGATVAESVSEALRASDLVILALFDVGAIKDVMLAQNVKALLRGHQLINIAHTTPQEIQDLARDFANAGAMLSEVSVVAYPDIVRLGTADLILAGRHADVETIWKPVFRDLSANVHYVGDIGNASKAEMALWLPYAFQTIAIAYGVAAFRKEGLPQDVLASILSSNPILRIAGAESAMRDMANRSYGTEQWSIANHLASLDLTARYAARLGLPVKVFEAISDVFKVASARGLAKNDVAAVYEALDPSGPAKGA